MSSERRAGEPVDRLLALYLALAALPLLLSGRPDTWPLLLALHLVLLPLAWPTARVRALVERSPQPAVVRFLLDWYPVLLVPALYAELAVLNRAVHGGSYFDAIVQRWELTVFGSQPSQSLAAHYPVLWLSELLHGGYLSYYFIIYMPPLLLYLAGRRAAFRRVVFSVMFAFVLHYIFFIYFPVQGPRYLLAAPGGVLARGHIYQLAHRILEAGSSQGAAFPSSHVGVSVAQTLTSLRFQRRLTPILALLTLLLAFGAIYGGFHYAIDAACGLLLGTISALLAPVAYRALGGRWASREV